MRPPVPAARRLVLAVAVLAGCRASDATGVTRSPSEAAPTATFLAYTSDAGDYVGGGAARRYAYAAGAWTARVDTAPVVDPTQASHVSVTFQSSSDLGTWWNLDLQTPKGQPLAVGTYESATRWPFEAPAASGLSFTGSGRGCNTVTGRFTITYLKVGTGGAIDGLHATFEQHCEGASPALRGEVAVAASPWR